MKYSRKARGVIRATLIDMPVTFHQPSRGSGYFELYGLTKKAIPPEDDWEDVFDMPRGVIEIQEGRIYIFELSRMRMPPGTDIRTRDGDFDGDQSVDNPFRIVRLQRDSIQVHLICDEGGDKWIRRNVFAIFGIANWF